MQQINWARIDYGILLLLVLAFLYLYFLPALLAFQKAHRRFWVILALNVLVAPLQSILLQFLLPVHLQGMPQAQLAWISFLYCMGPGWVALLVWALRPVPSPDPGLVAFGGTKFADRLAGLPLLIWFVFSVFNMRSAVSHDWGAIMTGTAELLTWLRAFSILFSVLFLLLSVWLLLVRDTPVRRIGGVLPRLCAIGGTFLGVGILRLPVVDLNLPLQALTFLLTGLGSLGSFLVLWRLGKSFSIVPEARNLVTSGPYAWARHPLYAVEALTVLGLVLQYQQPWAGLLGLSVIGLQISRSLFEEQVLTEAFPEYIAYRLRVKRFGIV